MSKNLLKKSEKKSIRLKKISQNGDPNFDYIFNSAEFYRYKNGIITRIGNKIDILNIIIGVLPRDETRGKDALLSENSDTEVRINELNFLLKNYEFSKFLKGLVESSTGIYLIIYDKKLTQIYVPREIAQTKKNLILDKLKRDNEIPKIIPIGKKKQSLLKFSNTINMLKTIHLNNN